MASILSLNDDCLLVIVSCIDDPNSFYSFALTCKRVQQVTKNTQNVLHSRLLRVKAEYYIKRYIVDISSDQKCRVGYDAYCRLSALLKDAVRLTSAKGLLTYAKVEDVWQRNGPVAAKLFMWIRELSDELRITYVTEYRSVRLHLPSCNKRMLIETYFDYDKTYKCGRRIRVVCGDLDVKSNVLAGFIPKKYMYWPEKEVSNAMEPMKPAIELLQNELGDTVPPITGHFFIWLCYFFSDNELLREDKLSFKETFRNLKPSPDAVQSAMDLFRQDHEGQTKIQSVVGLVSEWNNKEEQEPTYFKTMVETIDLLVRRLEIKVLKGLEDVAFWSYSIASGYNWKMLPKNVLLDLVLRTSLESSDYSPGSIADKYVENRVLFKCLESKAMKVSGAMHPASCDELELEFTLPDGKELKLRTEAVNYSSGERPTAIDQLGPVTELLQQGINQRMQGEKRIPKINNLFTAVYFLNTLQFSEMADIFLGYFSFEELFEMELDEQSTFEESDT